ncbi:MAG: DEAD/DEAH box helicase [Bacteroidaceae bacterium]|nr:DEAD/DEAH box helicase [Bacteroidaceae bacterium]
MKKYPEYILNALEAMKIVQLNPMQEAAIDAWSEGKDLVLLSPTGSGKTLAYLLPLLGRLQPDVEGVQAVVLVPSRELALQTEQVFKSMNTSFKAVSCYGGRPAMDEHRTLKGVRPALVIATPGRMNDHLGKGNIDASAIRTLVIDEFDKSLELGFHDEMESVISRLPSLRRRFLLSATDADEIPLFAGVGNQAIRLDFLCEEEQIPSRIRLHVVHSPEKDKLGALGDLLCTFGEESTLVFVNYREAVERVGKYLQSAGIGCCMFHGGMEQPDRERALYRFCNGSCHVFVCTDLAARGLDIPHIDNVVHYHLPANEDGYIHRNGRTARWEAEGNAFLLIHSEEKVPEYVRDTPEEYLLPANPPKPKPAKWATIYIGKGKKDKLSKGDIMGFLSKKGGLNRDDVGRIDVKEHYAFVAILRKKLAHTLNLVRGEKIKGMKTLFEEAR